MGLIHIYCGDGKGKTSAAIGLAVRAAGRGLPVVIARFLKTDDSGEVEALRRIPGITVLACTRTFGFVFQMTEETKREAAEYYRGLFAEAAARVRETGGGAETGIDAGAGAGAGIGTGAGAETALPQGDGAGCGQVTAVLILDEILAAVHYGMVPEAEVVRFLQTRPSGLEVVLTGRDPSPALLTLADYVSEVKKLAHPFDGRVPARKGIEY